MNTYNIDTISETGGKTMYGCKANSPEEAADRAMDVIRGWRAKDRVIEQRVQIMDGTKRKWDYDINTSVSIVDGKHVVSFSRHSKERGDRK